MDTVHGSRFITARMGLVQPANAYPDAVYARMAARKIRNRVSEMILLPNGNALKRIPNPEPQTKNLYTASALHHK